MVSGTSIFFRETQRNVDQWDSHGVLRPIQRDGSNNWCFSSCNSISDNTRKARPENRSYVSRSLSDRYSQTEKEALAIVWAVERLHLYLYGKRFTLYTDCKPVQLIFGNPKSQPPARIQRWNLRLQGYEFDMIHTKGSHNPSDFLSRHTTLKEPKRAEKMAEDYVISYVYMQFPKQCPWQRFKKRQKLILHCVKWWTSFNLESGMRNQTLLNYSAKSKTSSL